MPDSVSDDESDVISDVLDAFECWFVTNCPGYDPTDVTAADLEQFQQFVAKSIRERFDFTEQQSADQQHTDDGHYIVFRDAVTGRVVGYRGCDCTETDDHG